LAIGIISADELARYPVWALSGLGGENAGVVAGEEDGGIGIGCDASEVAQVGGCENFSRVTSLEERLV